MRGRRRRGRLTGYGGTMTATHITIDENLAEGCMKGFDAAGELIVELQISPIFKRIVGTQDDDREVAQWVVGKNQARRIAAVAAWNSAGNPCGYCA